MTETRFMILDLHMRQSWTLEFNIFVNEHSTAIWQNCFKLGDNNRQNLECKQTFSY